MSGRKEEVDIEGELALARRRCDHCLTQRGMPHKRTGQPIGGLQALHVNGDRRDRRGQNVMIICASCAAQLAEVRRG